MNSTQVVTKTPVRLSYCYLNSPRKNDDGSDGKYGAMLIIPKTDTATVKQLNDAIEAARVVGVSKGVRNAKNFPSPLRDGDGLKPRGGAYGPECKGCWVLNTSSKRQPKVVDRHVQPIIDPDEIYSGMWAIVDINFACFSMSSNSGISCYLNNVQKIRDDEPLGGSAARPEDVFSAVQEEDDGLGL
jgi:hypothetical protein